MNTRTQTMQAPAGGSSDNGEAALPPEQPKPSKEQIDPGAAIRVSTLSLFLVLMLLGIVCVVAGFNKLATSSPYTDVLGTHHPSETVITEDAALDFRIGEAIISCASMMLLPLLCMASWRTVRWRCQLAKQALSRSSDLPRPNSLLANSSLPNWLVFWQIMAWVNAIATIILLIVSISGSKSLSLPSSQLGTGMIAGAGMGGMLWCVLWIVCINDQLGEVEEVRRRLRKKPRGDARRKEKQLTKLINGMVAIPGQNLGFAKYPVTQAQWKAVMGDNPSSSEDDNVPVNNVSWDDCQQFLRKLNEIQEIKSTGWAFRLPTEEEWEFACRAGATGSYCKLADGTEITESTLGQVAWFEDNSGGTTHSVGQKQPNAFGLYDMNGNVWEWTSTTDGKDIVCCGGSWSNSAALCTSSFRLKPSSSYRRGYVGFRLCALKNHTQSEP